MLPMTLISFAEGSSAGVDGKGGSFFLMEGAEAGEILAGLFQADVVADDADDVRLLLDAICE